MNNKVRKQIAAKTDSELDSAIEYCTNLLSVAGKSLVHLRRGLNSKLQALVDEKQARSVGTTAVYNYSN